MNVWPIFMGACGISAAFTAGRHLEKGDLTMTLIGLAIAALMACIIYFEGKGEK